MKPSNPLEAAAEVRAEAAATLQTATASSAPDAAPAPAPAALRALIDLASSRYRSAGRFAYHFARGKLGGDPAFAALLARGLLPPSGRILDLGCGQGLLAAWLQAAQQLRQQGAWPAGWPAPPTAAVHGIELMPADVARARTALADAPTVSFAEGDIRSAEFGRADVVVVLDVLHYIERAAQDDVLRRIATALAPRGRLLLRVGDAAAALPFHISNWVDRVVFFCRGHRLGRLHCRALTDWIEALHQHGFHVAAVPMSAGTPFANVLLVADLPSGQVQGAAQGAVQGGVVQSVDAPVA